MIAQKALSIIRPGFVKAILYMFDLKEQQKKSITHLTMQSILPTTYTNSQWKEIYHYGQYVHYQLAEVIPTFAKALSEFTSLTKLTLVIRIHLLQKSGFDKLAQTINSSLKNLKEITIVRLLKDPQVQNEQNNWTKKLREDIKVKIL